MLTKAQVTQALLKEYLDYDPTTGALTWIKKPSKRANLGQRAGSRVPSTGYRSINFFGRSYPEHHVVWCWYYGTWSALMIDHIDHVRDNNCIHNLREVTALQNAQNKRKRENTHVNEAGIWYNKRRQRYVAEISVKGKKVYQQSFVNVEDAITARRAKLEQLGFHTNHGI